jgi:hypothetical protein
MHVSMTHRPHGQGGRRVRQNNWPPDIPGVLPTVSPLRVTQEIELAPPIAATEEVVTWIPQCLQEGNLRQPSLIHAAYYLDWMRYPFMSVAGGHAPTMALLCTPSHNLTEHTEHSLTEKTQIHTLNRACKWWAQLGSILKIGIGLSSR